MSEQEKQENDAVQCLVAVIAASMFIGLVFGFFAGYGAKAIANEVANSVEARCD